MYLKNALGIIDKRISGGKTSGGVFEAIIDQIQTGTYKVNSIIK